jgi:hypothetical protein
MRSGVWKKTIIQDPDPDPQHWVPCGSGSASVEFKTEERIYKNFNFEVESKDNWGNETK